MWAVWDGLVKSTVPYALQDIHRIIRKISSVAVIALDGVTHLSYNSAMDG